MTVIQWSELQRDPRAVAKLAEHEDVHLRRRDGVELLLTRTERVQQAAEGMFIAARAVRVTLNNLPVEAAVELLSEEFPWLRLMPERAQAEFIKDFESDLRASAELGEWASLAQMLIEWKHTAEVYGDPELLQILTTPSDGDFGPVPPPPFVEE